MSTFAMQSLDYRKRGSPVRKPVPRIASSTGSLPSVPLASQRKPQCSCGGGCPRCRGTSTGSAATLAHRYGHITGEYASSRPLPRDMVSRFESTPLEGKEQTTNPDAGDEAVTAETEPGVLSPTPTATTYPGCTAAQSTAVETARTTAKTKADDAATAMTALKGGTGTAPQQTALTAHFGALSSAQFDTAKTRYTTISTRLANAALFACGSAPAQPYCGAPDNWCAGTVCPTSAGISYLCPNAFTANCAEPNLWSIMLHESGRAAGCCPPDVMPSAAGYPPAAPACLTNVYSYSGFARAV
jgi:hypothetical protein